MKLVSRFFSSFYRAAVVSTVLTMGVAHADEYAAVEKLIQSGQTQLALEQLDAKVKSAPRNPQWRFLQGVAQLNAGKTADATTTFTQLTQDFPELPEPYNNLAVLYANQNQLDKARTALEMAVRINPAYATAYENLGDVYAKLASQSYSKSLQLNATNPQASQKVALLKTVLAPSTPAAAAKTK